MNNILYVVGALIYPIVLIWIFRSVRLIPMTIKDYFVMLKSLIVK